MKVLELKIPPLLLMLVFAGLMWLLAQYTLGFQLSAHIRTITFIVTTVLGAILTLTGAYHFKKAQTTVNPIKPETSSALVTSGIYRYTRNPMYLAFSLVLLGWGLFLANIFALLMVPVFIGYLQQFQILPEEKILAELFKSDFIRYKQQVRRWL